MTAGDHHDEQACREAIAAGDDGALSSLGTLLAGRRGRRREAEATFRAAIAAGQTDSWTSLGKLLAGQRARGAEAEAAYREAIAAGNPGARVSLGRLLARMPGREDEAEQVYREALAVGESFAWANLASLLSRLPGRQGEAESLLRDALADAETDREIECAALGLANLLARRGDVAGAQAAQELGVPLLAQRIAAANGLGGQGESIGASRAVRFMAAVVRRPLVARLVAARHRLRHLARRRAKKNSTAGSP